MTQRRNISLALLCILCGLPAVAQIPDSLRGRNDLQSRLYVDNDVSSANEVTPLFVFSMHYDSSRTIFYFSECKRNGIKIHFPTWHYDSTVATMEAEELSNDSRTADIPLVQGDTISFYRELSWYNPLTEEQTEAGYYALDSLDYAIELVRSGTQTRLALLDSIGVLRRPTPGYPELHGLRPIIAHVNYVVPPTLHGDSGYLRVKLFVRGDGPHYIVRHDEITINPSLRLMDSSWMEYINAYGGNLGKRNIHELAQSASTASTLLHLYPNPTSGTVQIDYTIDDPTSFTTIAIYDLKGEALFFPSIGVRQIGINHTRYTFPTNGTYYVALVRDGNLITAKKITVQR